MRLIIVIFAGQEESKFADGVSYNGYAVAIVQNYNWLTNPDFLGDYRAPGYPIFVATIYSFFGLKNYLAVYILQALISTLMCFYIYKFAKKVFNEKVAMLSLIWSGFYVFYFKYVGNLLRETLVFFLIVAFFYYLYLYLIENDKKKRNFWLSIIFYFLLIHIDPRYLFYLPFLIILFIVYQTFWQGIKKYFIFLGFTILLMIPWTIRNYVAYDGFVLINTRTLDLTKTNTSIRIKPLKMESIRVRSDYPTEEEREIIKKGGNPNNRSIEEIETIQNDVRAPNSNIGRRWWSLQEQWRVWNFTGSYKPNGVFRGAWSLKHNISSIVCYGILLPFMIFSILYLFIRKNRAVWFLIFPLVIQTILHILMWGKDRYRNPIDSFVIILGTYGIYITYNFIRQKFFSTNKVE